MQEKEYKFLLSEDEFYKTVSLLEEAYTGVPMKDVVQVNHYYDTPDLFLYQSGQTLRVREKNGICAIEKKAPVEQSENFRIAQETSFSIDSVPESLQSGQVGIDGDVIFQKIGTLCTRRKRFSLPDGINIDCDENNYFSIRDYEIEIEMEEVFPQGFLKELIQKYAHNKLQSKYSRFITHYMKRVEEQG